jgi:hypothetical protein
MKKLLLTIPFLFSFGASADIDTRRECNIMWLDIVQKHGSYEGMQQHGLCESAISNGETYQVREVIPTEKRLGAVSGMSASNIPSYVKQIDKSYSSYPTEKQLPCFSKSRGIFSVDHYINGEKYTFKNNYRCNREYGHLVIEGYISSESDLIKEREDLAEIKRQKIADTYKPEYIRSDISCGIAGCRAYVSCNWKGTETVEGIIEIQNESFNYKYDLACNDKGKFLGDLHLLSENFNFKAI